MRAVHDCSARGTLAVIDDLRIQQLVLAKWDHYQPAMPHVSVQFLDRESFLDVAREDPRIADELAIGWFDDFEAQFRDPVLTDVAREIVTVCPPIMRDVVEPEPPRIQRAYVEGAFLRRMFRLLVDGEGLGSRRAGARGDGPPLPVPSRVRRSGRGKPADVAAVRLRM